MTSPLDDGKSMEAPTHLIEAALDYAVTHVYNSFSNTVQNDKHFSVDLGSSRQRNNTGLGIR